MDTLKNYFEPLLRECNRVLDCMSREHPSSSNYRAMVEVLSALDGIVSCVEYDDWRMGEKYKAIEEGKAEEPKPFPTTVSSHDTSKNDPSVVVTASSTFHVDEPVSEPVGEPERSTVVEEVPWVEDTEEKELTREDVRAICKDMAAKGVLVQPIMTKYIPEGKSVTLSNLKSADYPAFVKELKNAK